MIIGVPKEIKLQEHRIGLTPESVKALTDKKHEVLVQDNGGFEAGFTNEDYLAVGAKIIKTPEEIFKTAELIVKVKEPQMNEVKMIRENQIIYTYLHLAAAKELTLGLMESKSICIAYETVTDENGRLPLLSTYECSCRKNVSSSWSTCFRKKSKRKRFINRWSTRS
jgi:alanine dehydrogenase